MPQAFSTPVEREQLFAPSDQYSIPAIAIEIGDRCGTFEKRLQISLPQQWEFQFAAASSGSSQSRKDRNTPLYKSVSSKPVQPTSKSGALWGRVHIRSR